MKKLLLVSLPFLIIGFFLASCQLSSPNDTVLVNHSSRTVTVNLTGASGIIIAPQGEPGSIRTVETRTDMNPQCRMQSFSPHKRVFVRYTNSSLTFDFFDRDSYEVRILNRTGYAGILTAEGWMDHIPFAISNTEQAGLNWRVYTPRPRFTATTSDGARLAVLPPEKVGNVFTVIIGN